MGFHWDHNTAAFGTPITDFAPPVTGKKAKLTSLVYTPGATEHDLVILRCIDETTLTAAVAAAGTTLPLVKATFNDQTLASGDYVILEHANGSYGMYLASALATLDLTVNAIAYAASAGARVWIMGAAADSTYHTILKSGTSARLEHFDSAGGLAESGYHVGPYSRTGKGDPLAFLSANGTAAGILNRGSGTYVN